MTTPSSRRLPRNFFDDAAPFKIDGEYCKLLPLTQGRFAIVNAADYLVLSRQSWRAFINSQGDCYAVGTFRINGIKKSNFLHRHLLGLAPGDEMTGDHRDTWVGALDNRRSNLRIATRAQQQHNKRKSATNTSGFKGVYKNRHGTYNARLQHDGINQHLGSRKTARQAWEELYVPAAAKYHKEFARTL